MKNTSRRSFLKYAAAGASAVTASRLLSPLFAREQDERPYVDRCTYRKVYGVPGTCAGCAASCGILAYVKDGQLLKVGGNPAHPVNKGSLCLVGQAGVYTLYDPERVLKPKMRIGKRGQGRWADVSWDEAISMLAESLRKSARRGLILETGGGSSEPASIRFLERIGGGTLVSHGYIVSPSREAALTGTFGAKYDWPDIAHTSYILNFGANPYESGPFGIGVCGPMARSREKTGAVKLVTIDPRLSATAGRSDEWLPLLPGTDAAVALAMANVIMSEGLHDEGFIKRHVNATSGELKAHLARYTPPAAERISGVKAADIRRVAIEYASMPRACLLTGGGVSKHASGTSNERAVRLLMIITGKINRSGCNIIPSVAVAESRGEDAKFERKTPGSLYQALKEGGQKAGVYIVHACDPLYSSPEPEELKKVLLDESRAPFIVSMDTHVTDTGLYADLVLPMATYLEEYGVATSPGPGGETVVSYRQPAVQPAGESRPYIDTLAAAALKAGITLGFEGSEDYASQVIVKAGLPAGVSDSLAKKGFYAPARENGIAARPLGRIHAAWPDGLPGYSQPGDYKNMAARELVMVTYAPMAYRQGITENNLLLREIYHANRLMMNWDTARSMGIKEWDRVKVASATGEIEAVVALTPGMHPRVVALARGCGHEGYGKIERAERFESQDPFTRVIWWDKDGHGVNPNRITPFNMDRASGGQGSQLTKVTVEKAWGGAKNG